MDALQRDDIDEARRKTPQEKFLDLLDTIETGMRMKRAALHAKHPDMTVEEVDALFDAWLDAE